MHHIHDLFVRLRNKSNVFKESELLRLNNGDPDEESAGESTRNENVVSHEHFNLKYIIND